MTPEEHKAQRDAWLLLQVVYPEKFVEVLDWHEALLDTPGFLGFLAEVRAAAEWAPDDPRLDAIARRYASWLAAHPSPLEADVEQKSMPSVVEALLTDDEAQHLDSDPVSQALLEKTERWLQRLGKEPPRQ
ncbi:MAG: hypothetical protein Q4D79_02260 [Propionibacteriaceae bacterium]|nr:hypothetical protein [Propionibacteriaceae bacterium]